MKIAIGAVLLALALAYVPNHHEAPASQPHQPATHLASHVATHPTPTRQAAPPPVHHATTHHTVAPTRQTTAKPASRYTNCDPGNVCGTCPNGDSWSYLAGSDAAPGGPYDNLFFDDDNPCS